MIVPVPVSLESVICASVVVALKITVSSLSVIASSNTSALTFTTLASAGKVILLSTTSFQVVPPSVEY